jgi:hypothetical protein
MDRRQSVKASTTRMTTLATALGFQDVNAKSATEVIHRPHCNAMRMKLDIVGFTDFTVNYR